MINIIKKEFITCDRTDVCGEAGVCGFEPDGGVIGRWKRKPDPGPLVEETLSWLRHWAGDPGLSWPELPKNPLSNASKVGTGDNGFSSSVCERLRFWVAVSSTNLLKNAWKEFKKWSF